MVFLNFYFDLFVTPPSLFMLLCSRLCCDYFPILHDPSRSSLTSRDASRFFSLLFPYASLFSYNRFYADYDYFISPFHSHCYLSLAPYVFISFLLYVLFSGHTEGTSARRIRLAQSEWYSGCLQAPPTKDYLDPDPWQETGVRLLPLEPRGSKTWS